jgi:hypothetical protein
MTNTSYQAQSRNHCSASIEPPHIMFRFSGADSYGKVMDSTADEYSSVSKIV